MLEMGVDGTDSWSSRQSLHFESFRFDPGAIAHPLNLEGHVFGFDIAAATDEAQATMLEIAVVEGFDFGWGGEFA